MLLTYVAWQLSHTLAYLFLDFEEKPYNHWTANLATVEDLSVCR